MDAIKVLIFTNIAAEFKFIQSIENYLRNNNIKVIHESDFIEHSSISNNRAGITGCMINTKLATQSLILRLGPIGPHIVNLYRLFVSAFAETQNFKRFKNLVFEVNPDLILVGTDNTYRTLSLVSVGRRMSIPIICFPYSLSNSEELLFSAQSTGKPCGKGWTYILGKIDKIPILRRLSKFYKNLDGVIIPCPVKTKPILQLILGIDPRDPWVICGGNSNYVFVGSQFEKKYYQKSGVPDHKMLTYSLSKVSDANKFVGPLSLNSTSLDSDIVWAPPPDFYANLFFEKYEDFIIYVIDILEKTGLSVKISPHPRSESQFFKDFIKSKNIEVSEVPIHELLRHTKRFIASQSATIRFALMQKIPIVNFDIFNFNYTEYHNLPMVIDVKSPTEFMHLMRSFSTYKFCSNWGYDDYPDDFFCARSPELINELLSIKNMVDLD